MHLKASSCSPIWARNYVRVGVQCFASVLTAMAIFSPPKVWDAVGVAQANPQFVMVLINLHVFNRWLQKMPLLLLSGHLAIGAFGGAALGVACIYLTYLANASSYDDTAIKAVVLLLLSAPLVFVFTLLRFKFAQLRFGGLLVVLVLSLSTSTTYRTPDNAALWEFPIFYATYATCAALFGLVVPTLVLPTPSGLLARQKLAKGLRGVGRVVSSNIELLSAKGVAPKEGQARTGAALGTMGSETLQRKRSGAPTGSFSESPQGERSGASQANCSETTDTTQGDQSGTGTSRGGQLDSLPPAAADDPTSAADGLKLALKVHSAAMAAGDKLQVAMVHIAGARYEVDLYRPTHLLPLTPFTLLAVLGRAALSAITMIAGLPQATSCSLECHSRRSQLLEVASAYERGCNAIAAALEFNQPIEESLEALEELIVKLRALVNALHAERAAHAARASSLKRVKSLPGRALAPEDVTLDMVIALLTTACSRLRLMCMVLPSALARDQRGAEELAQAAFQRMPPWKGARPSLELTAITPAADGVAAAPAEEGVAATPAADGVAAGPATDGVAITPAADGVAATPAVDGVAAAPAADGVAIVPAAEGTPAIPAAGGMPVEGRSQQASGGGCVEVQGEVRPAGLLGSLLWHMRLPDGGQAKEAAGEGEGEEEDLEKGPLGLWELQETPGELGGQDASEVLARLQRSSMAVPQAEVQRPGWHLRLWHWFLDSVGCTPEQVFPAIQMTVAYLIVMALAITPFTYYGLGEFTQWAMTIVVVLLEPSTGSMVLKALLRAGGTLLGVLQGVGIFYLSILADGFSYENRPQKFIVTSLALSAACGLNAAAAVRMPRTAYLFLTASVCMVAPALPNYSSSREAWRVALWRSANTAVGMGVHLLCIWAIFPVTSGRLLRRHAQAALQQLATASEVAITSILPQQAEGHHDRGASCMKDRVPAAPAAVPAAKTQAGSLAGQSGGAGGAPAGHSAAAGARTAPAALYQVQLAEKGPAGLPAQCSSSGGGGASAGHAGSPLVATAPPPQRALDRTAGPARGDLGMEATRRRHQPSILPSWLTSESGGNASEQPLPAQLEVQQGEGDGRQERNGGEGREGRHHELAQSWAPWLCPALGFCGRPLQLAVERLWGDTCPVALLQGCGELLELHVYTRFYVVGYEASVTISDMGPLIKSLRYEWRLLPPHRPSQSRAAQVRLLLRGMLNVVSSLASSMDAHRLRRVELLAPYREQVDTLVHRLRLCLQEFAGLVSRRSSLGSALAALFSLERQLERLLLLVLLVEDLPAGQLVQCGGAGAPSTAGALGTAGTQIDTAGAQHGTAGAQCGTAGAPGTAGTLHCTAYAQRSTAGAPGKAAPCPSEVVVLSAFMSGLLGFGHLSRQLLPALVYLFYGKRSPEAQMVDKELNRTRRWSVDDTLLPRSIQALAAAVAATSEGVRLGRGRGLVKVVLVGGRLERGRGLRVSGMRGGERLTSTPGWRKAGGRGRGHLGPEGAEGG